MINSSSKNDLLLLILLLLLLASYCYYYCYCYCTTTATTTTTTTTTTTVRSSKDPASVIIRCYHVYTPASTDMIGPTLAGPCVLLVKEALVTALIDVTMHLHRVHPLIAYL